MVRHRFREPANLVEINPDTGALLASVPITLSGVPISIGDLAVQPGTDVLYGIRSNGDRNLNGPFGGRLYTIDTTTGVASLVGNTFQARGGGIGFAPDGTLYFAEFNQLHTLNTATAAPLTSIFLNFGGHEGLGIRPSDGTLFASQAGAGAANDGIRIIDPNTGVSTLLGNTGTGNTSDLAFRVETVGGVPDVDEYLLDLTGKAGQPIDIALSTDIDLSGGTGAQFNDSLTETNVVHTPNVLNFDFSGAPSPTGDATLQVDAIADLNGASIGVP